MLLPRLHHFPSVASTPTYQFVVALLHLKRVVYLPCELIVTHPKQLSYQKIAVYFVNVLLFVMLSLLTGHAKYC
jgi:hypothetical protein